MGREGWEAHSEVRKKLRGLPGGPGGVGMFT